MPWCCMQRDVDRLEDILTAAADIAGFCAGLDRAAFETDKTTRYAILHSLTIIGEAANRISEPLRAAHPEVPWRRIIAFRHRGVHGYGDLDLDLVWEVVTKMVPALRAQIAILHTEYLGKS